MKRTTKMLAAAVLAMTLALTGCGEKTTSTSAPTGSATNSSASSIENSTSNSTENSTASSTENSAESSAENSAASSTENSAANSEENSETGAVSNIWANAQYTEDTELGEGAHTIKLEVKALDKSVTLTVHSENDNLEKILVENKLVEGDNSEYGLYIKKVIGISADYDADGAYWALCKDGEMTATGASGITIADNGHYELVYTPADNSANTGSAASDAASSEAVDAAA